MSKPESKVKFKTLQKKTQKSFGYQWSNFSEMSCDFKDNFLNYIKPLAPEFFKGKLGLDAGCGFGRHIYHAALFGARMIGMDFSVAIKSTQKNTSGIKNISLVQGDIFNPPFAAQSFDFVYSIGVLHHLPDPERGFQSILKLVKKEGSIFIWVYSKRRKLTNLLLESARKITRHLPMRLLKTICLIFSLIDWVLFIWPYRVISRLMPRGSGWDRWVLARIKLYSQYPFQVTYADWFDRLSAPIRFYYDHNDLESWAQRAGLKKVMISETGSYGWRLYGVKA
ncbi:class I SAM-dependent methyltransferase [Candidatus Omnitrophota bacterium]